MRDHTDELIMLMGQIEKAVRERSYDEEKISSKIFEVIDKARLIDEEIVKIQKHLDIVKSCHGKVELGKCSKLQSLQKKLSQNNDL